MEPLNNENVGYNNAPNTRGSKLRIEAFLETNQNNKRSVWRISQKTENKTDWRVESLTADQDWRKEQIPQPYGCQDNEKRPRLNPKKNTNENLNDNNNDNNSSQTLLHGLADECEKKHQR